MAFLHHCQMVGNLLPSGIAQFMAPRKSSYFKRLTMKPKSIEILFYECYIYPTEKIIIKPVITLLIPSDIFHTYDTIIMNGK